MPYLKAEIGYKKFGAALDVAYVNASHFFYLKSGLQMAQISTMFQVTYMGLHPQTIAP